MQKQDSKASNLQRGLSNEEHDVGEILLQRLTLCQWLHTPLHKLLSLQVAQDIIMSTAAEIGSTSFDEMQGKASWLQGKFL